MKRLLRLPEVEHRVGLKRSTIYKQIRAGTFVTPIKLGRTTAFVESEIESWISDRIRTSREPRGHAVPAQVIPRRPDVD